MLKDLVPEYGVKPSRPCGHRILSPARQKLRGSLLSCFTQNKLSRTLLLGVHPIMAELTPEPVLIPTLPVEPKSKLTLGDSIGAFALLIGVFLVIVIPPLPFKIVLLVGVGVGVFLFSRYSHWTHGWAKSKQYIVASILTVVLCAIAIPQFVAQWRDEHSKKAEAPPQSSSQPSPEEVVTTETPQTETPIVKPAPSTKVVKHPSFTKSNPIPTSSQQQSGTNNVQIGPTAIAPNGIANAAPNFGTQTVSNVPPARRLPEGRTAFISCLKLKPGKFSISALANNQEAYNYAQDWHDVLLAAGWEIEHKNSSKRGAA
jgi:hypothetical protein